ncbi:MAG: ATP-grasp domain-containing protein [Clostridia bacterium]|nr:ATP-grasp domain-containing protein [Clostridia bacterium]
MSKQLKALVIAGGISQAALITDLKNRGIYTILVDKNPKAYAVPFADAFYPISTLDEEAIKQLAIDEKVDMVLTACADQVLLVVAKVSEELGLPCYIDYKTALLVSDKQYMKAIFEENGIPTAKHVVMAELDEEKITVFEYPLIVKPVDCYSSRGVRKVENIEELRSAFAEAVALSRTKTAIVEEFCEGIELTVDVYVEEGKAHVLTTSVSDKIAADDRFVIYRTKNPASISKEIEEKVAVACQQIAEAFGIKNSPMLVQLITNGRRIDVLEFCARTGGCIKYQLIKKASGFDVIAAVADLTLGIKPHVGELKAESKYIVNTFLYCDPGVFDHVEGLEELMQEKVITEYAVFAHQGRKYTDITCSGDRVCSFTIQDDSVEELNKKNEYVLSRIAVRDQDGKDILRRDLVKSIEF